MIETKVIVNGKEKDLKKGAKLKDAIKDEFYVSGSLISVHLSTEKLVEETNDFELITSEGTMVLHLNDTDGARLWKSMISSVEGSTIRWSTREIVAFGAFKTDIPTDRVERRYRRFDCFFTLGGFDNHTTYMMIAKKNHVRSYGASIDNIGRITVGRHIIDSMIEGEELMEIRPVVSESSTENVIVTKDLEYQLDEGYSVETNILIELDRSSPASSEQILAVTSKGHLNITESTGTIIGCRDDLDVRIPSETQSTREVGSVVVRNTGFGMGHIMIYKERRQTSPSHNIAGNVRRGMGIVSQATKGDTVSVLTEPSRLLTVGMTQSAGEKFLSEMGIKQKRSGDTSDDAIIVDQDPEMTMAALQSAEIGTVGAPRDRVFRIQLNEAHPNDVHYFRKVTGLSHKPIGSLKTQFSFPGMPMMTFYGDEERSKSLYPQDLFKKCKKGDIGITNQSRPHHGLMGIRLEDSKEYGPTGEEPYGTNIVGKFIDDLSKLSEIEEEEIIYITEEDL